MASMFVKDPAGLEAFKGSWPNNLFKHHGRYWQRIPAPTSNAKWVWMPGKRPFITTEMCQNNPYELYGKSVDWVLTNTPGIEYVSWPTLSRWFGTHLSNLQKRFKKLPIEKKNGGNVVRIHEPEDLGITDLFPFGDDRPWGKYPGFRSYHYEKFTPEEKLYVSWRAVWFNGDVLPWMVPADGDCLTEWGEGKREREEAWQAARNIQAPDTKNDDPS